MFSAVTGARAISGPVQEGEDVQRAASPDTALNMPLNVPKTGRAALVAAAADAQMNGLDTLPSVLWSEIGKFGARHDLLSLRTVSRTLSDRVDKSIDTLRVSGENAAAMLATVGRAVNFKHIRKLAIDALSEADFPKVIAALAAMPHGKIAVEITPPYAESFTDTHFAGLRKIAPASLHLSQSDMLTPYQARCLAALSYPVRLSIADHFDDNSAGDLLRLTDIPNLVSLKAFPISMSDELACAFAEHPALTDLSLKIWEDAEFSDTALVALAHNPRLTNLHIRHPSHIYGPDALTALAANRTLESLSLTGSHGGASTQIDAAGAAILAQNTTLKTLEISLGDGYRHIAKMASLQHLVVVETNPPVSVPDASAFAQHARLNTLTIIRGHGEYSSDALVKMLSCAVENVHLEFVDIGPESIVALAANKTLRSVSRAYASFSAMDFAYTFALASNPALSALRVYPHAQAQQAGPSLTPDQHAAISAVWAAGRRPAANLSIHA